MRIGPLLLETHGARKRLAAPRHDAAYYFESLHTLCRIMDNVPWLLAGGLTVPFTLGKFFREHHDIDIMVPFTSMARVTVKFRSAGYRLFKRVIVSHNARGFVVRYPVREIAGIKPSLNCAMLKVKGHCVHQILRKIDIHPYQITDGVLLSDYRGPALAVNRSIKGCPIETGHDTQFRCLDLPYVARLKQARHGVKHEIDLIAIEQGIGSAVLKIKMHQRSI